MRWSAVWCGVVGCGGVECGGVLGCSEVPWGGVWGAAEWGAVGLGWGGVGCSSVEWSGVEWRCGCGAYVAAWVRTPLVSLVAQLSLDRTNKAPLSIASLPLAVSVDNMRNRPGREALRILGYEDILRPRLRHPRVYKEKDRHHERQIVIQKPRKSLSGSKEG